MKEVVHSSLVDPDVPKSQGGAVAGQREVALSSYKRGAYRKAGGCGDRLMNLINSFLIASEKPVSHEVYSTSQCRDSAESVVGHITSESPLPPGKHVATTRM